MTATVEIGGREIEVSHPRKVMFPRTGATKLDLARYYARVAETAWPHWEGRTVTMQRWPDGLDGEGFFQKHAPDWFADWIPRAELPKEDGTVRYVVAGEPAVMAWLAAHGCVTPHLSLARAEAPRLPDRLVLDLDPSDDDYGKVREAARLARRLLERIGAPVFVQTTGSRGVHVTVPLDGSADFDAARELARALAGRLADAAPALVTTEMRKDDRGDRVFADWLRNAYGQTAVAPYAVRAVPEAAVATPIDWDELGGVGPRYFTMANLFRRLGQKDDPWRGMDAKPCAAATLRDALERLGSA